MPYQRAIDMRYMLRLTYPCRAGRWKHSVKIEPEISGCSIVLLGKFNPAIFQPAWLIANGIERHESEVEMAVLHKDVAQFSIGTRNYFVDSDRFQVTTASAPWVLLSDTIALIFGELLPHTPVHAFGVNRDVHFRLPTAKHRLRLGRKLAPIEPWGDFGASLESIDEPTLVGGLQRLTMRKQVLSDRIRIHTNATVEPSVRLQSSDGVFMQINTHHSIANLPDGYGAGLAVSELVSRFESCLRASDEIIDTIMTEGSKG